MTSMGAEFCDVPLDDDEISVPAKPETTLPAKKATDSKSLSANNQRSLPTNHPTLLSNMGPKSLSTNEPSNIEGPDNGAQTQKTKFRETAKTISKIPQPISDLERLDQRYMRCVGEEDYMGAMEALSGYINHSSMVDCPRIVVYKTMEYIKLCKNIGMLDKADQCIDRTLRPRDTKSKEGVLHRMNDKEEQCFLHCTLLMQKFEILESQNVGVCRKISVLESILNQSSWICHVANTNDRDVNMYSVPKVTSLVSSNENHSSRIRRDSLPLRLLAIHLLGDQYMEIRSYQEAKSCFQSLVKYYKSICKQSKAVRSFMNGSNMTELLSTVSFKFHVVSFLSAIQIDCARRGISWTDYHHSNGVENHPVNIIANSMKEAIFIESKEVVRMDPFVDCQERRDIWDSYISALLLYMECYADICGSLTEGYNAPLAGIMSANNIIGCMSSVDVSQMSRRWSNVKWFKKFAFPAWPQMF